MVQQRPRPLRFQASAISRRLLASTLGASMLVAGCDPGPAEAEAEDEVAFGLGGKADSTCPADEPLCWHSGDIDLMKEILREQDNVLFGHEPKASLGRMLELAGHLRHKLPPEVADAVPDLQARIDALPEGDLVVPEVEITEDGETILPPSDYRDAVELLADLKADVLEQAEGAYYLANAVPLGQSYDAGEKADDEDDPGVDPTNNEIPPEQLEGLSEGMQHSLQLLRDSGIIGMSMATVYTSTGILEIDYPAINAENFGELGPDGIMRPSGLSREAKVRRIVNRYVAASAAVGAGAGVVSLVPVAGTALSISGEMFLLLKLHAQMTFEIAAVYGWDIREGDNLYLLSTMLMAEGLATETADVFLSNYLVPLMAKKLAKKFGFQLGSELASQLAQRSIRIFLQLFTRRAQEQLAKEALEGTAKGIGKTILGWATLGAAIIISAGADAVATWYLGRQIETMSKRWLHDLLLEGQTYLARPEHRDCAFRSLAAVAWADGEVTDNEQRLFQAFLGKPYAADEQTWFTLGSDERVRQSAMLAAWPQDDDASGVRSCLTNRFQKSDPEHRVSLLGHLYSMMLIDGEQGPDELELYEEYRDGLDGAGWFDGSAISEDQMLYIERAVFLTVNPNIVLQEVSEEYDVVTHGLLTQDVLDFLAEPNETVQADFDCGFAGEC